MSSNNDRRFTSTLAFGGFVAALLIFTGSLVADESKPAAATSKSAVNKQPEKIYDTTADGKKQIADALKKAKAENKRVLLKFGANWCGWCHRLSKCFKENEEIADVLKANYVLVLIDVDVIDEVKHNADVLERYGNPNRFGLPALVILDSDGKQLTTKNTEELEEGDHHDPAKVLTFLEEWRPSKKARKAKD